MREMLRQRLWLRDHGKRRQPGAIDRGCAPRSTPRAAGSSSSWRGSNRPARRWPEAALPKPESSTMPVPAVRLILASTSRYRRELLARLRLPFEVARPETDETPLAGETPLALARRLARPRPISVAVRKPRRLGDRLGPGRRARRPAAGPSPADASAAIAQLAAMSGRAVQFHTGGVPVACRRPAAAPCVDTTTVRFRALAADEIERYCRRRAALRLRRQLQVRGPGHHPVRGDRHAATRPH